MILNKKLPIMSHHGMLMISVIFLTSVFSASSAFLPLSNGSSSHLNPQPFLSKFKEMSLRRSSNAEKEQNVSLSQESVPLRVRGGATTTQLYTSSTRFNNTPFVHSSMTFLIANTLGWVISLLSGGSHLHLDLIGTGAFAVVGLRTLVGENAGITDRVQLSAGYMTLWGAKLAGFLFFRALQTGHDARLDETLSTFSGTTGFWIVSFLWGMFASLPHTLGATSSAPGNSITTVIGSLLYIVGLVFETLADVQKWRFKQNHPGQFCNIGVWSISQHPNWFGNLALWSGIFVLNAPSLLDIEGITKMPGNWLTKLWAAKPFFLALSSPLFLWLLFSGQASGSVTSALDLANKRYGSSQAYRDYVESVPLIFPNPFQWNK